MLLGSPIELSPTNKTKLAAIANERTLQYTTTEEFTKLYENAPYRCVTHFSSVSIRQGDEGIEYLVSRIVNHLKYTRLNHFTHYFTYMSMYHGQYCVVMYMW